MLVVKPVEKSEEENGKKKTIFFHLFIVKRFFPTRTRLNSTSALLLYSITIIHLCDLIVKNLGPVSHVLTDNGPNPFFLN